MVWYCRWMLVMCMIFRIKRFWMTAGRGEWSLPILTWVRSGWRCHMNQQFYAEKLRFDIQQRGDRWKPCHIGVMFSEPMYPSPATWQASMKMLTSLSMWLASPLSQVGELSLTDDFGERHLTHPFPSHPPTGISSDPRNVFMRRVKTKPASGYANKQYIASTGSALSCLWFVGGFGAVGSWNDMTIKVTIFDL